LFPFNDSFKLALDDSRRLAPHLDPLRELQVPVRGLGLDYRTDGRL
jgi:hypothetical protein